MYNFKKVLFTIFYWTVNCTWGALLTIPGALIFLFCVIFLKAKVHRNGCSWIAELGGNWGGLELGPFAICGTYSTNNNYWFQHTRRHEFGHTIQLLIFGPFYLFVVGLPSVARYWYRRKRVCTTPYDAIWFEYTASKWGYKFVNWLEDSDMKFPHPSLKEMQKKK